MTQKRDAGHPASPYGVDSPHSADPARPKQGTAALQTGPLGLAFARAHDVADRDVPGDGTGASAHKALEQHKTRHGKRQRQKHAGEAPTPISETVAATVATSSAGA